MAARNEFLGLFDDSEHTSSDSHDVDEQRKGNLASSKIDAIDTLTGFVETIRANEIPVRHQHDFIFDKDTNPDIFPDSIADYIMVDQLRSVTLTVVFEQPLPDETEATPELIAPECVGFSIEIEAGNRQILISRDPASYDAEVVPLADTVDELLRHGDDTIIVANGEPRGIPQVSRRDINRTVVGLITNQLVERDVEKLDEFDIYSEDTVDKLISALVEVAPVTTEHVDHTFNHGRTVKYRQVRQNDEDNLQEITLRYETGNPDRKIVCSVDFTKGIEMKFETADPTTGLTPFVPGKSELRRLSEVMKELEKEVQPEGEMAVGNVEPHVFAEMGSAGLRQAQAHLTRYGSSPEVDAEPGILEEADPSELQRAIAHDEHYGETSQDLDDGDTAIGRDI